MTVSRAFLCCAAAVALVPGAFHAAPRAAQQLQQQQDFLTQQESDKIRDAGTPSERIKLFLAFADDRLQKFQYELNRQAHEAQRAELLNNLLNAYVGCVDDAADQLDVAQQHQADVREAVKLMQTKDAEFLAVLQKLDEGGPELESYRFTLEDAIEGTKEALNDAKDAAKSSTPAPVRRKQQ